MPSDLIETAMQEELQEDTVIADRVGETDCVFLAGLYHAEKGMAQQISRIGKGCLPWPEIDADKALP